MSVTTTFKFCRLRASSRRSILIHRQVGKCFTPHHLLLIDRKRFCLLFLGSRAMNV